MHQSGDNIFYHPHVVKKDIPKLDASTKKALRRAIEAKLATRPELYGLPLRATLKKYWKLRVGDYRIVYGIKNNKVYILIIAHRKDVYTMAEMRK